MCVLWLDEGVPREPDSTLPQAPPGQCPNAIALPSHPADSGFLIGGIRKAEKHCGSHLRPLGLVCASDHDLGVVGQTCSRILDSGS